MKKGEHNHDSVQPYEDPEPMGDNAKDDTPRVYAVKREGGRFSLSRRGFIAAVGAAGAANTLAGCPRNGQGSGNGSALASLTVTLLPQTAAEAGAHWRIDNGQWRNSGETAANIEPGNHTVSYDDVDGWNPPGPNTVRLEPGESEVFAATYLVEATPVGSLSVTIAPQEAVDAGARWRVDGGAWRESGDVVDNLEAGAHEVECRAIDGWNAPVPGNVAVDQGETRSLTVSYARKEATRESGIVEFDNSDVFFVEHQANLRVNASRSVSFSQDGKTLLTDGVLWTIDKLDEPPFVRTFERAIGSRSWQANGGQTIIALSGEAGSDQVLFLSASTGAELRKISTNGISGSTVNREKWTTTLSHDGRFFAWHSDGTTNLLGGHANIWDVANDSLLSTFDASCPIAISPDGGTLCARSSEQEVSLYASSDGAVIRTFDLNPQWCCGANHIAFSPNGHYVVVGHEDSICIFRTNDGGLHLKLQGAYAGTYSGYFSVSRSSDVLAVVNGSDINLYSIADGSLLKTFRATCKVADIAFSPTEDRLASVDCEHVVIWETCEPYRCWLIFDRKACSVPYELRQARTADGGSCVCNTIFVSHHYTLSSGSVCVCDQVTVASDTNSGSQYDGGGVCVCDTICTCDTICSCVGVCSCVGHSSGGGGHYWYSN